MTKTPKKTNTMCRDMFAATKTPLQRQAWYVKQQEKSGQIGKVIFCILVDSCWNSLVEVLMPNHHQSWDEIRAHDLEPIAIGITTWDNLSPVVKLLPTFTQMIKVSPPEGMVRVVVLSDEGGSICEIRPRLPDGMN